MPTSNLQPETCNSCHTAIAVNAEKEKFISQLRAENALLKNQLLHANQLLAEILAPAPVTIQHAA